MSAEEYIDSAYEAVSPICHSCGRSFEKPQELRLPSTLAVVMRCECGALVRARFYRLQIYDEARVPTA